MKRDKAIDAVKELPKEFELEELIERLVFVEKVELGLTQLKKGKTVSHSKVKEMMKIVWTGFALEDLSLIHEYISKDSKIYTDRVIDKIINRVDQLQAFAKSGRVVPEFMRKL
jgi:hypothetical protein